MSSTYRFLIFIGYSRSIGGNMPLPFFRKPISLHYKPKLGFCEIRFATFECVFLTFILLLLLLLSLLLQ